MTRKQQNRSISIRRRPIVHVKGNTLDTGKDCCTSLHNMTIPGVLFAVVVFPPLDAPLPDVPAGFVGDVLPRAGAGFAAVVPPPRPGAVLPLPLMAAPPRTGS